MKNWKKILWYVGLGLVSAVGAVVPEIMADKAAKDRADQFTAQTGINLDEEN